MEFRLGFGPMSESIVDCLSLYANDNTYPLMIIASRNQVDFDGGYVMTTQKLSQKLGNNGLIKLCRDHCGPYFKDSERHTSFSYAIESTKKTIVHDIENGFDLIHIDTSRCDNPYKTAEELIKFCQGLQPSMQFEFGSEENSGSIATVEKYAFDVSFAKNFANMEFVVAQTGSLVYEDKQVGVFNTETVKRLVDISKSANIKLKEHNADYLTDQQIQLRAISGVNAMNIAPQLGVIQTRIVKHLSCPEKWTDFAAAVIASHKWDKWTNSADNDHRVAVSGHYLFSSDKGIDLLNSVDYGHMLRNAIIEVVNHYRDNIGT